MKRISMMPVLMIVTCLCMAVAGSEGVYAQTSECLIKLKSGRTIKNVYCAVKGDQVITYRYGGTVEISRSEVESIDYVNSGKESVVQEPNPDEEVKDRDKRQKRGKQPKPELTELEQLDKKIAESEKVLQSNRNSQKIYCGQAAEAQMNLSAAPNIPAANQGAISEATFERVKQHIQGQVEAYRTNESCEYYNKTVPRLEQELEELKKERDLYN